MVISRWDPFGEFVLMRDATDLLWPESSFPARWSERGTTTVRGLPVDLYETGDAIVVKAYVPGVKPEEVIISLEEGKLTINAHVPSVADEDGAERYKWFHHELGHGDFSRSLAITSPVDTEKVDAVFDSGVLTLTIPKAEAIKPHRIQVKQVKSS